VHLVLLKKHSSSVSWFLLSYDKFLAVCLLLSLWQVLYCFCWRWGLSKHWTCVLNWHSLQLEEILLLLLWSVLKLYMSFFFSGVTYHILCCRQKICKKPWWSLNNSLKTFRGTNMKWVWILACHGDGHTPAEVVVLTNGLCMTSECCGQNVQLHVIGYHLEYHEQCEVFWLALKVCQLLVAFNIAYGF
jgi:hypothetical protein